MTDARPAGNSFEAVVERLTGRARSALGVVLVTGPDALLVANKAFRPAGRKPLSETPPHRLRFGRMGAGLGDEVVAVWKPDPQQVEVQCHGGSAAIELVCDALVSAGARVTENRAEDSRVSFQQVAQRLLAQAPTLRAAEVLLDQAEGAVEHELKGIDSLLESPRARSIEVARVRTNRLIELHNVGARLISGWRVALAGRPNVGKSRLLNAIVGYSRAIVAPTPGTTRDIVSARLALGGWPVELHDSAGIRDAADLVEREGVLLARRFHEEADLVLVLIDGSSELTAEDEALLSDYPHALNVRTKSDLPQAEWAVPGCSFLSLSAETGAGLGELERAIIERLIPDPPAEGEAVPLSSELFDALCAVVRLVDDGQIREARERLGRLMAREGGRGPSAG